MNGHKAEKDEMMFDRQHSDGKYALGRGVAASGAEAVPVSRVGREDIRIMIAIRGVALFGEEVVV